MFFAFSAFGFAVCGLTGQMFPVEVNTTPRNITETQIHSPCEYVSRYLSFDGVKLFLLLFNGRPCLSMALLYWIGSYFKIFLTLIQYTPLTLNPF